MRKRCIPPFHSPLQEAKRKARHDEKFGVKENPFYVHLEPYPMDVLNKKKQVVFVSSHGHDSREIFS